MKFTIVTESERVEFEATGPLAALLRPEARSAPGHAELRDDRRVLLAVRVAQRDADGSGFYLDWAYTAAWPGAVVPSIHLDEFENSGHTDAGSQRSLQAHPDNASGAPELDEVAAATSSRDVGSAPIGGDLPQAMRCATGRE